MSLDDAGERRALAIFAELCDEDSVTRERRLAELSGDDPELEARVRQLLFADEEEERFLPTGNFRPQLEAWVDDLATPITDAITSQAPGLERYEIERELGSGGMGVVHLAQDQRLGRKVALKVLRASAMGPTGIRRFQREASLLASLRHPGIAQIVDSGTLQSGAGALPYFAMEYVDGVDVLTHASREELDTRARIELMIAVCDAVHHAHRRGIVHRDLKPDNVLVQVDDRGRPQPKILDFGIAKHLDGIHDPATLQTDTGQVLGTVTYMSPEQAEGRASAADVRTDVHALGAMCHQLVSGRLPFAVEGLSLPQALQVIAQDDPTRLGSIDTRWRGDLEVIVAKALAKEPVRRYDTAAALADDLGRFLRDEPITARPTSTFYSLVKFARRHRALVGGTAATILALVAGLVVSIQFAADAAEASREAERRANDLEREVYESRLISATYYGERLPVIASQELRACPEQQRGWEWRRLAALLDRRVQDVPMPDPDTGVLGFLVDQSLLLRAGARHLMVVDVPSGSLEVALEVEEDLDLASLADDGRHVLLSFVSGRLALWDAMNRRIVRETTWLHDEAPRGAISDGFRSALASGATIVTWVGDTIREFPLDALPVKDRTHVVPLRWIPDQRRLLLARQGSNHDPKAREGMLDLASGTFTWAKVRKQTSWIAASPDARRLARGRALRKITLSNADRSQPFDVTAHLGFVLQVAWSPSGRLIASESNDTTVRVFDARDGTHGPVLIISGEAVQLCFSRDDRLLAATAEGLIRIWNIENDPDVLRGQGSYVYSLDISPDDLFLASVGLDGSVCVWDLATRRLLRRTRQSGLRGVLFTPDGEQLVGMHGSKRTLLTWDWTEQLGFHSGPVRPATHEVMGDLFRKVAPNRDRLLNLWPGIAADRDQSRYLRRGKLFDLQTGERLPFELDDNGHGVGAAFTPDGSFIQTHFHVNVCSDDGARVVRWPTTHRTRIFAVAFSPDGQRMVTGGNDGTIRVWDPARGAEITELLGHTDYVMSVVFSRDGSLLASGSGDGTIRLWDSRSEIARNRDPRRARLREIMRELLAVPEKDRARHLAATWPVGNPDRLGALRALLLTRL